MINRENHTLAIMALQIHHIISIDEYDAVHYGQFLLMAVYSVWDKLANGWPKSSELVHCVHNEPNHTNIKWNSVMCTLTPQSLPISQKNNLVREVQLDPIMSGSCKSQYCRRTTMANVTYWVYFRRMEDSPWGVCFFFFIYYFRKLAVPQSVLLICAST